MRIATWNVNGIRACEKGGFLDWVGAEKPDVLCLQEVRAEPEQMSDECRQPGNYEATWHPAKKKGYSGVATWVRGTGATTVGIGDAQFDDEGRVLFTRLAGFTLCNVYVPNGSRDHSRVPFKLDFYQKLHDWVQARHAAGECVVICGDWNTAHTPIDLAHPKANEKTTGFLPEERAWIDKFLALGLVDVFRAAHPDEKGHYTWWSQRFGVREKNVGWRLDYFLASEGLVGRIAQSTIQSRVKGSDHCPVLLELN